MTVRSLAIAVGALLLAAGAQVAPAAAQAASQPQVAASPRAVELVKRILKASGVEEQIDQMMATLLPKLAEVTATSQQLSPSQQQIVVDVVREVMRDTYTPKLLERMVPIYASTFSEAELEAIANFQESPAGRALKERTPELMRRSSTLGQDILPLAQAEVVTRLCARVECRPVADQTPS